MRTAKLPLRQAVPLLVDLYLLDAESEPSRFCEDLVTLLYRRNLAVRLAFKDDVLDNKTVTIAADHASDVQGDVLATRTLLGKAIRNCRGPAVDSVEFLLMQTRPLLDSVGVLAAYRPDEIPLVRLEGCSAGEPDWPAAGLAASTLLDLIGWINAGRWEEIGACHRCLTIFLREAASAGGCPACCKRESPQRARPPVRRGRPS